MRRPVSTSRLVFDTRYPMRFNILTRQNEMPSAVHSGRLDLAGYPIASTSDQVDRVLLFSMDIAHCICVSSVCGFLIRLLVSVVCLLYGYWIVQRWQRPISQLALTIGYRFHAWRYHLIHPDAVASRARVLSFWFVSDTTWTLPLHGTHTSCGAKAICIFVLHYVRCLSTTWKGIEWNQEVWQVDDKK